MPVLGNASIIDRFNKSTVPKWVDILATTDNIEVLASTIAHEIGHTTGLVHSGTDEEVMRCSYSDTVHQFLNTAETITIPLGETICFPVLGFGTQNPVYHLRRWVKGDSDEELRSENIFPGSRDTDSILEQILLTFRFLPVGGKDTSSDLLYDVNIFTNDGGDVSSLLVHFDEIDLDDLAAIGLPLPFGATLNIFASSVNDGRENDIAVALAGDPFDPASLRIPVVSGQQSAMLQLQTGPDSYTTLADVTVSATVVDAPISAVSRVSHGSAGAFDVSLPLTGEPEVECRDGAGNYTIVATFPNSLVSGTATVTSGSGEISGDPVFSGNTMTINLTSVTDIQVITVMLSGVTDTLSQVYADTPISMALLIGDVTGDKTVNKPDFDAVKAGQNHPVDETNFRDDVDINGLINRADGRAVKSRKGHSLP